MKEVILHVYDVTNSASAKANNTILQINRIFKDRIGLGGIFHSAVQVPFPSLSLSLSRSIVGFFFVVFSVFGDPRVSYDRAWLGFSFGESGVWTLWRDLGLFLIHTVYEDEEWSFGFCEYGSGVFSCPPGKNPMYTYRECIILGETNLSKSKVNQILRELSREWPGNSYDLLSKNCNHFCDLFCERLEVPKLPAWVNRFANAGDTAVEIAGNTALRFRQAKTEIVTASKVAYRFISGLSTNSAANPESPSSSNGGGIPRFQGAWFKNLLAAGAKPTSTPEVPIETKEALPQQEREGQSEELLSRSRSDI